MGAVHRALRFLSTVLITAGLVVLADVALTLVWKEPVSSVYGAIQQNKAEDELAELERSFPSAGHLRRAARRGEDAEERARILAKLFERRAKSGTGIGRVEIPEIDLDVILVEGTDTESLQKGPGRYPDTAMPGQGKTIGIAGHRTTYLAPFRRINKLEQGDEIIVEMPYASFTYEMEKHRIVEPHQVGVVRNVGFERVVLTACHPLYSAAQRYVVFGRLKRIGLKSPVR